MPTVKPINAVWKLVPAGKGMSMIQSEPLPEEDAKLRLADLEKEEGPGESEEEEMEQDLETAPAMEARAPKPGKPGMPMMPPFGKKEGMAAMFAGAGGSQRQKMPPFGGM